MPQTQRKHTVKRHQDGRPIVVECLACYDEEGSRACIRPSHDSVAKGRISRPLYTPVSRVGADLATVNDEEALVKILKDHFRKNETLVPVSTDQVGNGDWATLKELRPYVRGGVRLFNYLFEATSSAEAGIPKGFSLNPVEVVTKTKRAAQEALVAQWIIGVLRSQLDAKRCCENGLFGRKHICRKQPA